MIASDWLDVRPGQVMIRLRVQPCSPKPGIAGIGDRRLRIRVSEPPTEGRANEAVIRLLAKLIAVPKSAIEVRRGAGARQKTVCVSTIDPDAVAARLRALIPRH